MPIAKPYRIILDKPKINFLVYGPPGVGKTTFAASAQDHPDLAPVLVANFEGGLLSLTSRGDIDAVDITSMEQLDDLFWKMKNNIDDFGQYRTLVIDSGTELQTLALEETTRKEILKDQAQNKGGGRTIDDLEIRTYGTSGTMVSRLMRWFRDLDVNLIVTALPKYIYSQGADKRVSTPQEVTPAFTSKLGISVMGYVDMVWFLGEKDKRRFLLTQDNGIYRAKTRGYNFAKALGEIYPDPWVPDIYNLLLESEKSKERAQPTVNSIPLTSVDVFAPVAPLVEGVEVPEQEVAEVSL